MNILLVGGSSKIMDAMIDKLNKGSHRVYLLTGRREKKFTYKRAFERYDFLYDDDNVMNIAESVKPEAVLFMGAYDTNFDWSKGRQEAVRFTSSLINLLSVCSAAGKNGCRFLYLSSQEVYSGSYGGCVLEDEPAAPKDYRAMALAQGESICENYRKMQGINAITLRMDRVYGIPREGQEEDNPCFRMCLEALRTGSISADSKNVFSMIYLSDEIGRAHV